jgi:hypothetical protein
MAKKTVVATLKKRDKKRPMAYVDKRGNVCHFAPRRKSTILQKGVVSKDLLKRRRGKWSPSKIFLYLKGKKVMMVKRARPGGRKGRKTRRRTTRRAARRHRRSRRSRR